MKPNIARLSASEFLDWDANTRVKHEYVDGEIYAMSGASRRHNLIVTNLIHHARRAADARARCQVFGPDMKVRIERRNSFYYPDLSVCCDPTDRHERYLVRPCFIAEVLSPSTAAIDRREKRVSYATLESIREYVIVEQDRMRVELYQRAGKTLRGYLLSEPDDALESTCLGLRMPLRQVYEGVEFPPGVAESDPAEYFPVQIEAHA